MNEQHHHHNEFYGLGIAPALLQILSQLNFKTPTPIQAQAIPIGIEGKDIVGIAQTGTGKTLAFGIPVIQRLAQIKGKALIVLLQVEEVLRTIGKRIRLRTAVLIGGAPMGPQLHSLSANPHIIIATPGRLIDHLNQKNIRLNNVSIVVFDEADRMLDMGFAPQVKKIFQALPDASKRQTMLFSATMPPEIMEIAVTHMKLPVRVEIAPSGTTVERVTQELFIVPRDQKLGLLKKMLETYHGSALIFTRTKHVAKKIVRQIRALGFSAAEIHSNRTLSQRKDALQGFKSGKYRVLVATDIASRGIDVVGIELVLNFDLPATSDDYVHRIGRTARAGAVGHAITFAMPGEQREVRAIENLIRKRLPISKLPELPKLNIPEFFPSSERRLHSISPPFRGGVRGGGSGRPYHPRRPRNPHQRFHPRHPRR